MHTHIHPPVLYHSYEVLEMDTPPYPTAPSLPGPFPYLPRKHSRNEGKAKSLLDRQLVCGVLSHVVAKRRQGSVCLPQGVYLVQPGITKK